MRASSIDFASRSPARALQRSRWWQWIAGCTGLILCGTAALNAADEIRQRDELRVELDQLRSQREVHVAARKPRSASVMLKEEQANAINTAIARLNLPWRQLFEAIEEATPSSVALLALESDAAAHRIEGVAEAKTSEDMIAYIEQLKSQPVFREVLLTNHETNEQDPNRPLRFRFEAQWDGLVR